MASFLTNKTEKIKELIEKSGKYTVQESLDEGANGYAFRATHNHLSTNVFLKVIDADPEVENTFAEPKALSDASFGPDTENLVHLFDAEHLTPDYVLMAMEFVPGGSLGKLLKDGPLHQMDAVQLAMGVLVGVAKLHEARFLHRDIKPGNLLASTIDNRRILKLGDFGSVRRLHDGSGKVSASKHSALYRPLEAWGDDGWFTFSSDLYQVGVCLYEMINGSFPNGLKDMLDRDALRQLKNEGKTYEQLDDFDKSQLADGCIERRIASGQILSLTPPLPYFSKKLAAIIRKATATLPENRYQTAFDLRNALQALSLPNWFKTPSGYEVRGWRDFDWLVFSDGEPSGNTWDINRARAGSSRYRSYRRALPSAQYACRLVEEFI